MRTHLLKSYQIKPIHLTGVANQDADWTGLRLDVGDQLH